MHYSNILGLATTILIAAGMTTVYPQAAPQEDFVKALASRLDLEKYKATIKGLAEFGDRRAGTEGNRKAVDWIQKQLESYRCFTDRLKYQPVPGTPQTGGIDGPREQVFCTKIGTTASEEMYIVGAHLDGQGGQGADDNASGTAVVMELARVFSMPDVQTERSIRFVLWNNGGSGQLGVRAYIQQRMDMQGKEDYPGSGSYPEARWLGLIEHDMLMWDHGAPREDGSVSPDQRPEADVNIQYLSTAKFGDQAMKLAFFFRDANATYASDYPAVVSPMPNIDSTPFMDLIPAISIRENEHKTQIGPGWSPHWQQPTDAYSTYSDKDFRLGLNAAQTTLGAIAQLVGARQKK